MALSSNERAARYRKKHPERARESVRDSLRRSRAAEREAKREIISWPDPPADPAGAVADWARANLVVPPGHPKAGQPFELPPYLIEFFRDALAPDTQESLNCLARKNSKSGAVAVLLLAHLVGPLMREGWRCGVASLSREKASELKMQVEAIAKASGLEGVQVDRQSAGRSYSAAGGNRGRRSRAIRRLSRDHTKRGAQFLDGPFPINCGVTMAKNQTHRRCRICDRPIPAKRAATHPRAVLCGATKCVLTDHKRQRNIKATRQRNRRIADDPSYRARQLEKCRYYYVKRRLAAGKIPAERAPIALERGPVDTFLAAVRRRASGALTRAARAFGAFCG